MDDIGHEDTSRETHRSGTCDSTGRRPWHRQPSPNRPLPQQRTCTPIPGTTSSTVANGARRVRRTPQRRPLSGRDQNDGDQARGGKFVETTDFVFNNLTYKPSPRSSWKNTQPLGETGTWTAADGRQWHTECGRRRPAATAAPQLHADHRLRHRQDDDPSHYEQKNQWIFNNIVQFEAPKPEP